jgi:hypothetical protein
MTSQPGPRLNAAFYADSVAAFLRASDDEVYAPLASPHGYTLAPEQLSAWRLQLPVLRAALAEFAARALAEAADPAAPITPSTWGTGSYSPTPTIIEAARSLYARHTVHDITRSDAGAVNLAVTSAAVERIIAGARERRRKAIVFVTGVPGAGKTLVGLNVATRHGSRDDAAHAVFLSGNGPRKPGSYERIYDYLTGIGVAEV